MCSISRRHQRQRRQRDTAYARRRVWRSDRVKLLAERGRILRSGKNKQIRQNPLFIAVLQGRLRPDVPTIEAVTHLCAPQCFDEGKCRLRTLLEGAEPPKPCRSRH